MPYARVAISRPIEGLLTYAIPAFLLPDVRVGHVVLVPFGKKGAETGYVVELTDVLDFDPAKVKPIQRLVDPEPAFGPRQLEFFKWIAEYYLAPLGLVIHTALPARSARACCACSNPPMRASQRSPPPRDRSVRCCAR